MRSALALYVLRVAGWLLHKGSGYPIRVTIEVFDSPHLYALVLTREYGEVAV